jgi:DNA-binding IclR family transcriptional regulator
MASDPQSPAPAVARAFQILEYLANVKPEAGSSEIATALGINKSTCFNILKTLANESAVIKNAGYPVYRLGPRLVELGTASRRNFSRRDQIGEMVRPLVEDKGVTCLLAQPLPGDRGAIVVDRIIPRGKEAVTAPIGEVYSITAPAMGRILLAERDVEEVLANAATHPDVDEAELEMLIPSLDEVRSKGYGWSQEEYQTDINAVAAPVHNAGRQVALILCLIGSTRDFPTDRIDDYGEALREVAQRVESALLRDGGAWI